MTTTHPRNGLALALVAVALATSGCHDQGPQLAALPQSYSLVSIGGRQLPIRLADPGSPHDFVTVSRARIEFEAPHGLVLRTGTTIVRHGPAGDSAVVATGESVERWSYERAGGMLVPYRIERGTRTDAPFRLAIEEKILVMRSEQPALKDWRFVR